MERRDDHTFTIEAPEQQIIRDALRYRFNGLELAIREAVTLRCDAARDALLTEHRRTSDVLAEMERP